MNITEIIEKRDCGELRINFSTNFNDPLNSLLSGFGLAPNEEKLTEVTIEIACEIVEAILWRDLAYSSEMMSREEAKRYSEYLIYSMAPPESTFYTNADWHNFHGESSFGYSGLTSATFDGGIICVGKNSAMSIWVKDED